MSKNKIIQTLGFIFMCISGVFLPIPANSTAVTPTAASYESAFVPAGTHGPIQCVSDDQNTFLMSARSRFEYASIWTINRGLEPLDVTGFKISACSADGNMAIGYQRLQYGKSPYKFWSYPNSLTDLGGFVAVDISKDGNIIVGEMNGKAAIKKNLGSPEILANPDPSLVNYYAIQVVKQNNKTLILGRGFHENNRPITILWTDGVPEIIKAKFTKEFRATKLSSDGGTIIGDYSPNPNTLTTTLAAVRRTNQDVKKLNVQNKELAIPSLVTDDGALIVGSCYPQTYWSDAVCLWNQQGAIRPLWDLLTYEYDLPFQQMLGRPIALFKKDGLITLYGANGEKAVFPDPNQASPTVTASGSMLTKTPDFSPTIRFSEQVKQTSEATGEQKAGPVALETQVTSSSTFSVKIKASLENLDIASINESTEASLKIGEFQHSSFLSSAIGYRNGKNSATFAIVDTIKGLARKVGSIQYKWNQSTLQVTVSVKASTMQQIVGKRYRHWDGNIEGWVPVQITFGNAEGSRSYIVFKGKNNTTSRYINIWDKNDRLLSVGHIKDAITLSGSELFVSSTPTSVPQ
jgi:hypothetical protein